MTQAIRERLVRVGFFDTVAKADRAIRDLLAAGFSKDELGVICPERFHDELRADVPRAQPPGAGAAKAIVRGGVTGAALGGLALAAAAVATGGAALIPAIPMLVGGGAFAGGFANLILSDGYGKGVGEFYDEAIHLDRIAVGVEVAENGSRLDLAERILNDAGAEWPANA